MAFGFAEVFFVICYWNIIDYIDTKKGGQWPPNLIIITIDC